MVGAKPTISISSERVGTMENVTEVVTHFFNFSSDIPSSSPRLHAVLINKTATVTMVSAGTRHSRNMVLLLATSK